MNRSSISKRFYFYLLTTAVSIFTMLWAIPLLITVLNGLKNRKDIFNNPIGLPEALHFENYMVAFKKGHFESGFTNSILLAAVSVFLIVVVSSAVSYPISRINNKFNKFIFNFLLAGLMIPSGLTMIPTYRLLQTLKLINTPFALIFLHIAVNTPFIVFIYTGFLKSVPRELDESATIDGCGKYRLYWRIIFPLLKPVTGTVVILVATTVYNDFFTNLLFANRIQTITMCLFNFKGLYLIEWNMIFAGVTLALIPPMILFLLFQKYFVKGLTAGSVKG